jgi:hypothetical protein
MDNSGFWWHQIYLPHQQLKIGAAGDPLVLGALDIFGRIFFGCCFSRGPVGVDSLALALKTYV